MLNNKLFICNGNETYESEISCQSEWCVTCVFRFKCFTSREINISAVELDDMARDKLSDVVVTHLIIRYGSRAIFYYNKLFDILKARGSSGGI